MKGPHFEFEIFIDFAQIAKKCIEDVLNDPRFCKKTERKREEVKLRLEESCLSKINDFDYMNNLISERLEFILIKDQFFSREILLNEISARVDFSIDF